MEIYIVRDRDGMYLLRGKFCRTWMYTPLPLVANRMTFDVATKVAAECGGYVVSIDDHHFDFEGVSHASPENS